MTLYSLPHPTLPTKKKKRHAFTRNTIQYCKVPPPLSEYIVYRTPTFNILLLLLLLPNSDITNNVCLRRRRHNDLSTTDFFFFFRQDPLPSARREYLREGGRRSNSKRPLSLSLFLCPLREEGKKEGRKEGKRGGKRKGHLSPITSCAASAAAAAAAAAAAGRRRSHARPTEKGGK